MPVVLYPLVLGSIIQKKGRCERVFSMLSFLAIHTPNVFLAMRYAEVNSSLI